MNDHDYMMLRALEGQLRLLRAPGDFFFSDDDVALYVLPSNFEIYQSVVAAHQRKYDSASSIRVSATLSQEAVDYEAALLVLIKQIHFCCNLKRAGKRGASKVFTPKNQQQINKLHNDYFKATNAWEKVPTDDHKYFRAYSGGDITLKGGRENDDTYMWTKMLSECPVHRLVADTMTPVGTIRHQEQLELIEWSTSLYADPKSLFD